MELLGRMPKRMAGIGRCALQRPLMVTMHTCNEAIQGFGSCSLWSQHKQRHALKASRSSRRCDTGLHLGDPARQALLPGRTWATVDNKCCWSKDEVMSSHCGRDT